MKLGLPLFARTTTFRLAMLYGLMFAVFSAVLLAFLYVSTVGYIRAEDSSRIDNEVAALRNAYNVGGLPRLGQALMERASTPNRDFLYQLETNEKQKMSGDLTRMPDSVDYNMVGPRLREIEFDIDVRTFDRATNNVDDHLVNGGHVGEVHSDFQLCRDRVTEVRIAGSFCMG